MSDFTSMYIKKSLKEELDKIKVSESESYNDVIRRLIRTKNWCVVNGSVVHSDPTIISMELKNDRNAL